MTAMIKKNQEVLLPYNSPSLMFDEVSSKVFHAAAVPWKPRSSDKFKVPTHFTGSGSIGLAAKLGLNVTMTVSSDDSLLSTRSLIECANMFIDPANPFAFVDTLPTSETTIAGQVRAFFAASEASSVLVVWPYQIFDLAPKSLSSAVDEPFQLFTSAPEGATFAYTHHMMQVMRSLIPEAVAVAPREISNLTDDIVCANACSVGTVDDMLKGSFTRLISMVAIDRDDFAAYSGNDIAEFLGQNLQGKRGVCVDPTKAYFMGT